MKMGYPLTQAEKREICAWKYEGGYAAYNLAPYESMVERQAGFQIVGEPFDQVTGMGPGTFYKMVRP